jgi:anti-anti-sigma regulatory factor
MSKDSASFSQSSRSDRHDSGVTRDFIAVARGSDLVVIKIVGKGNMLNASALSDFAEEQRKAGFTRFVFDMERCRGLDSTFMGVMVGMHATVKSGESARHARITVAMTQEAEAKHSEMLEPMSPQEAAAALNQIFIAPTQGAGESPKQPSQPLAPGEGVISAVNVSSDLRNLMSMLGVDKFVKLRGNCDLSKLETTILPEKNIASDERRKLILKAHENLVEIDKRNLAQFGPFLKSLSNELSKEH